jgi:hypothetical protein
LRNVRSFFAKVPFYNKHLIRFFAAISVIAAVGWGPLILASGLRVILETVAGPDEIAKVDFKPTESQYFSLTFSIMASIYSVIAIELTLLWNSVRDVYTIKTTGQLLPFVIGLVALAKCLYKSILDHVRICAVKNFMTRKRTFADELRRFINAETIRHQ